MASVLKPTLIQLVASLGAGSGRALTSAEQIEQALRSRGWSTRLQAFDDLGRLARWSATCRKSFSHLVCVGGDATMSAAAVAAIRHGAPMLPVPSGFGNLFARTFGHSDDPEAVADLLETGEVIGIDAGTLNGEIFLSLESFGMLNDIQAAVEENGGQPKSKPLRLLSYFGTAGRFLLRARLWSFRVEVDGALVARSAVLVTVANVRAYGAVLPLTPDASPVDGLLDVFVIPRTTPFGLWSRLLRLLLRLPPRSEEVLLRRGRRISVSARGRPREDIRVLPGALPLLVPRGWQEQTASGEIAPPDRARDQVA
ncbi:MAG TPA: diacylglycerol kinase family protein [Methylomirabilota bacterium]|nr:diacylglycerol kinase family protein [Methylomirabilota bacterium]